VVPDIGVIWTKVPAFVSRNGWAERKKHSGCGTESEMRELIDKLRHVIKNNYKWENTGEAQ
jgi:hypothetical protein